MATGSNLFSSHEAKKLVNTYGGTTQPVYINSGVPTNTTYTLGSTLNAGTASRIAYFSGANAVSAGSVTTDGGYLGNVSYLSVNTAHQTNYRLYTNGNSYLAGDTTVGTKSQYIHRDTRGQVHHEIIGNDSDYGVVRIRHLSTEGSGSPGSYTATLGIIDERTAGLTGTYEPTLFIKRTGTHTSELVGVNNSSGRVFTIANDGQTYIKYFSSSPAITSRLTSLNFTALGAGTGKANMRLDLVTTSISDSTAPPIPKTNSDSSGYVLTFGWDSAAAQTQLYIPNGDHVTSTNGPQALYMRGQDGSAWSSWIAIPTGTGLGASGTWGINISGTAAGLSASSTVFTRVGEYSHIMNAGAGTSGYFKFARIVVSSAYTNSGIQVSECPRGGNGSIFICRFSNAGSADPTLSVQHFSLGGGAPCTIYYVKVATSTWDLYIQKEEAYGHRVFNILNPGQIARGGITWTWYNDYVTSLPSGYLSSSAITIYGAVWNDYAEFRQSDITEPGRCVREVGDDTLVLTDRRLQPGCEIISDTFGFAIGETDDCKTPIASSGRVLAYPYEDREEFRKHIGEPVCSGPNGTVSIMTPQEEKDYPSRIIGTISAVPDYEEWGTGNVQVNGRVWIRIR